jgi:hypothetical protein
MAETIAARRGVQQFTVRIASRDLNGCEAGT